MREDDIFVVSFPKCGTTLTMELCWLVRPNKVTQTCVFIIWACVYLVSPTDIFR